MKFLTAIYISTALASAASAIPNVVPKLFTNPQLGCRSWPQNPYMIVVDSSEDDAINKFPVQERTIQFGANLQTVLAVDLRASRRFAKHLYACSNGVPTLLSSKGEKLSIREDRNNAEILTGSASTDVFPVELYQHSIDGVVQSGLYLGTNNLTTWSFHHVDYDCNANPNVSKRDYYEVRLLGLPESEHDSAGSGTDFKGFLRMDERWA